MKILCQGEGRFIKPFSIEFEFKHNIEILVGNNASGKSSLLTAIRGSFIQTSSHSGSLYNNKNKALSKLITLEHNFDKAFFYDAVQDNPKDLNNCYDAMEFINSGALMIKSVSHGQGTQYLLSKLVTDVITYRKNNPEHKILIILDEPEVGLDIRTQFELPRILSGLIKKIDCYIICATHNYILITNHEEVIVADKMQYSRSTSKEFLSSLNK